MTKPMSDKRLEELESTNTFRCHTIWLNEACREIRRLRARLERHQKLTASQLADKAMPLIELVGRLKQTTVGHEAAMREALEWLKCYANQPSQPAGYSSYHKLRARLEKP